MELVHRRDYRVSSWQIGPRHEVRPSAIMGMLEDAAGEHAAAWKLSVFDLLPRGLTWVLARYHLKILKHLAFGERVEVTTWPSGRASLFALRDFEVAGAGGEPVAQATTSWAMVDVEARRLVKVTDVVPAEFELPRRAIPGHFASLPRLEGAASEVELPVMRRDLDMNEHVNHVVYVQWALEAVAPERVPGLRPVEIEVTYRAEAQRGDVVVSSACQAPEREGRPTFLHRIARRGEGQELARLRTSWGR